MSDEKIYIRCDPTLKELLKQHCKCQNITISKWIREAIANELNVTLNPDGSVDAKYYVNAKIRELDTCIDKLEKEKLKLQNMVI